MPNSRTIGLVAGAAACTAMLLAPTPAGLSDGAWHTSAVATLMAVWWLTEALPIPATALLPIVLFPVLGVGSVGEAAAPYANPIIFLFLGGFLIAMAMERSELHRRIALEILSRAGSRPAPLIGGFMGATALLSMWVSNSAVALMMLPIGLSVIRFVDRDAEGRSRFGLALMLAIAYGASIGGLGTLVGTPPNAFLAGFLGEAYGIELGFGEWMRLGIPLVAVALPLVFLVLTRVSVRVGSGEIEGVAGLIRRELESLGPSTAAQRRVAIVFALAAVLWIGRPFFASWVPGLSDAGIAVGCGVLLFLLPSGDGDRLLDWETAERLPWGVLVLFGGGLSLASAIDRTELNVWLGGLAAGLADWPPIVFLALVTAVVVLLTELTSNTATAAAFLPVLGAAAVEIGWDPRLLTVPAALAASCAFMLPIATPPNAIAYGSGKVTIPEMARAGLWINLLMTGLIVMATVLLMPWALGVSLP
jgi:sodium-dependent dicarboxylate transporter 2/3/5